ncbi:MAG: hypothetical protein BWY24_00149 [Microgenomates group bacterium ADurb.Bin219]|nr:MAG: hypothetical protein BWY24_00149 [Microgenomates group bacterium ADurb.Bin219]HNP89610.1 hypothetical protein [Candidatus Woesebacteria bacterium]
MARKTKKQKIIADYRRKISSLENFSRPLPQKEEKTIFTPGLNANSPAQSQSIYIYPVQLIKKDLTKTLILSILAISFEVALFLLLQGKIKLPAININLPINLNFG